MTSLLIALSLIGGAVAIIQLIMWLTQAGRGALSRHRISVDRLATQALEGCNHFVPEAGLRALRSYLKNILPFVRNRMRLAHNYADIEITNLRRAFTLKGGDIVTDEWYSWTTSAEQGRIDFPIIQFGGVIASLDTIDARGAEVIDGVYQDRSLSVVSSEDRVIEINLRLGRRAKRGEKNEVYFQDTWYGAMLPTWDFVLVPHPCYFGSPLKNIVIELATDRDIRHVMAYSLSVITGQRKELEVTLTRRKAAASATSPQLGDIIYMLFERAPVSTRSGKQKAHS